MAHRQLLGCLVILVTVFGVDLVQEVDQAYHLSLHNFPSCVACGGKCWQSGDRNAIDLSEAAYVD